MNELDNLQIMMPALLQSAAGKLKRKCKLPLYAVLELMDNSKFIIVLNSTSCNDMC